MAESLHSTHTIVPVSKRLSALVTDADFAMAEESDQDAVTSSAPVSGKASPSGSVKSPLPTPVTLIYLRPISPAHPRQQRHTFCLLPYLLLPVRLLWVLWDRHILVLNLRSH